MRWALIAVFSLAALGAWGFGFQTSTSVATKVEPMVLPRVAMRALPALGKAVTVAKAEVPAAAAAPIPVAAKAPAPEPVAAPAPSPVAAAATPAPAPEKKETPRPAPRPVAAASARPAASAAEDSPAPTPPPRAAAKEKPADEAAAPAASSGSGEGALNLKASDTAEIVIDGRKVGPSPKLGYKVKSGKHKVRFDCYDDNGNLKPGKVQTVDVGADAEVEVSYDCPFSQ